MSLQLRQRIVHEMIADEIRYFEEDGMTVKLSAEQVVTMKDELLAEMCEHLNEMRDHVNDYVRAHAFMSEEEAKQ